MTASALERWFGDRDTMSRHWTRSPFVAVGTGMSPFGTDDLHAAVGGGALRLPYVEMVRADRRVVPAEDYTRVRTVGGESVAGLVDPGGVQACIDAGATLLLRNVDHWHPPSRALCERLHAETGRPAEAFVFLTPPGAQGLTTHRDDADVIVLQIAGTKSWTVGEGPADGRWRAGDLEPQEKVRPTLRAVLTPGDVLHVPRGFAHHAVGTDGVSVHFSITVRDTTTEDLRAALERRLAEGVRVPPLPIGDAAIRAAAQELLGHYRQRIAELEVEDLLPARPAPFAPQTVGILDGCPGEPARSKRWSWPARRGRSA